MANATSEPLEARRLNAAATLDPTYSFSYAAVQTKLGTDFRVIEAVPARGDRTFLLAVRDEQFVLGESSPKNLLTVIAVTADGTPDATFGDGGVALTNRTLGQSPTTRPARMAVDGAGRVYVADNTRVFRLTRRGTTDRTFGSNGAAGFAPAGATSMLCDLAATDNGVLVATTETARNVERFAVHEVGKTKAARLLWQARHDGGRLESQHSTDNSLTGPASNTAPQVAQFASSNGRVVLAHIERDGKDTTYIEPDGGSVRHLIIATRQDVVLTTFDATGHGTDVARRELRRPGLRAKDETLGTALGDRDYRYPLFGNVVITRRGAGVTVQTDQELLNFDLAAGTARRQALPARYDDPNGYTDDRDNTKYLLADGSLGVTVLMLDRHEQTVTFVDRYRADGTADPAFGERPGIYQADFAAGTDNSVDQIFLGVSGRLYLLATGTVNADAEPTDLTLRRLT